MTKNAALTKKEAGVYGCGAGTENACYALYLGAKGKYYCLEIMDSEEALKAANRLNGQINKDPSNGKTLCPKEILKNSKKR